MSEVVSIEQAAVEAGVTVNEMTNWLTDSGMLLVVEWGALCDPFWGHFEGGCGCSFTPLHPDVFQVGD
jgi:hypothetical protein